ncbi:MAG: hypothetical protein MJY89_03895 [Bacteroidales bacterium]|nr:hypothetical protein [Bacteroidales bacterium]
MASDNKRRHIISYEKMSPELQEIFNKRYPKGFNDYLADLNKYTKPDGTPFYAVMMDDIEDMPDDVYLVKIQVETDDVEDIERWLEGEEDAENEQVAGTTGGDDTEGNTLPDDNISQYSGEDDGADADV